MPMGCRAEPKLQREDWMTKPMARPIVELTEAEKEEERQEQKKVGRWAEKCGAGREGRMYKGGGGEGMEAKR